MASIGELFIELGVKADTRTISNVSDGLKSIRKNAFLMTAAFTGAVAGLDRFVQGTLKGVVALQNINQQTGLSIEMLQKWQQAGQLSNLSLSADQIAESISSVQKNLAAVRIGQGNIAPFQMLGIDINQDAFGVLEQLRGSIQGLSPDMATNLVSQLGLTPEFINVLKLSRKEFDGLAENTFLNKTQRADIDTLGTSMKRLSLTFKALKDQAVAKLAPALNELAQKFFKWIKDNGDKIISTMTGIAKSVARFAEAIGNAFDVAARFAGGLFGMQNGIKILAAGFGILALSMSPFLLGLGAIILLLDDIAVYKRGGDSLIGALVDGFKDLPDLAKILGGAAIGLTILNLATNIGKLGGALKGLAGLAGILSPITAFFAAAVAFAAISPKLGEMAAEKLDNTSFGQGLGDFLASDNKGGFIKNLLDKVDAGLSGSSDVNRPSVVGGSSQMTTVSNVFNINGLQDPQAVSREVNRNLTPITQQSYNNAQAQQNRSTR